MAKHKTVVIDDKALGGLLTRAMKTAPKEAAKALTACVLDLAGESARRAPIEAGDLRNNCVGKVEETTVFEQQQSTGAAPAAKKQMTGTVGYSLPYALRQHEDLALRHDRTDGYRIMTGPNAGKTVNMVAGGEAKYLERPFNERKARYIQLFQKAVEKSLEHP